MNKKEKLTPAIKERRKRVGENIKRLRKERGIKRQEDLAELLKMERSYIGRLESGHAPFGSEMEERFAKFFRVDIVEFYKGRSRLSAGETEYDEQIDAKLELIKSYAKKQGASGINTIDAILKMMDITEEEKNRRIAPISEKTKAPQKKRKSA